MQAIPDGTGEVWLESTSDGIGNYFYKMWKGAVSGKNDFLALFIPWFIDQDYKKAAKGFVRDDYEHEYAETCLGYHDYELTDEQLAFRRYKIANDFSGDSDRFKREYPLTPQEAFETSGVKQLIPTALATRAMAPKRLEGIGALVFGVDPARFGKDRTVIYARSGRMAKKLKVLEHADQMEVTGVVKGLIDEHSPDRVFIDIGMGAGVIDRLHEMGYDIVQAVDFGSRAFNGDKYVNRRNEMYGELLEWLKDDPVYIDCKDADGKKSDSTLDDLCSVYYKFDSKNRKVLEKKDETKKRLGESPDDSDALGLTFAEPVAKLDDEDDWEYDAPETGRATFSGY